MIITNTNRCYDPPLILINVYIVETFTHIVFLKL